MRFFAHGNHVEFLGCGDQFGDQHFEGVAFVVGGEEGPDVGLADEAEEFFPAAGDDEADEFAMRGGDLVLVDGALCVLSCAILHLVLEDKEKKEEEREKRERKRKHTGGTEAKSPGPRLRALSFAQTLIVPFKQRNTSWASR